MLVSSSNTMACFVRRTSPGDLLGYYVIGVGGKAGVPARKLLQFSPGAASLLLLQFAAQAAMSMPDALDGRAAVLLSGAGNGNLAHARIDSEKTFDIDGFRLIHMARGGEVENALVQNQVGLALPGLQQFCLARASFKRDPQAV